MQHPVQITFHGVSHSDAADALIRERAAKLEHYFDRMTSCRVVVSMPHRHHVHGASYHVQIDMGVPGHELVVGHEPRTGENNRDLYAAIDAAFALAERRLEQHAERAKGWVKDHARERA